MEIPTKFCSSCRALRPMDHYFSADGTETKSCYYCRENAKQYYIDKKAVKIVTEAAILCAQNEELLKLFSNILKK